MRSVPSWPITVENKFGPGADVAISEGPWALTERAELSQDEALWRRLCAARAPDTSRGEPMTRDSTKPSVFMNVTAWIFLSLMVAAGVVALFSASGATAQVLKVSKFELRTTSTAVLVMVIAAAPLWLILRFALAGRVRLFDDAANPPRSWIEEHWQVLEIIAIVLIVVGIGTLVWTR